MPIALPLSSMSRKEKLVALEAIWADLSQDNGFESPEWHAEALADSERQVSDGTATFSNWGDAKQRIRRKAARSK